MREKGYDGFDIGYDFGDDRWGRSDGGMARNDEVSIQETHFQGISAVTLRFLVVSFAIGVEFVEFIGNVFPSRAKG